MEEHARIYLEAYSGRMRKLAFGAALGRGLSALGRGFARGARYAAKVPAGEAFFSSVPKGIARTARATLLPNLGRPLNLVRAGLAGKSIGEVVVGTNAGLENIRSRGEGIAERLEGAGLGEPAAFVRRETDPKYVFGQALKLDPLTSKVFGAPEKRTGLLGRTIDSGERIAHGIGSDLLRDRLYTMGLSRIKAQDWLTGPVTPFLKRKLFGSLGQKADMNSLSRRLEGGISGAITEYLNQRKQP